MTEKRGRPRTTVEKLSPDWREQLVSCGRQGASITEMQVAIGVGDSGWATLLKDNEEFRLAVQNAKKLSQVWWETKGRELSENSAVAWKFNMQNRFGWSDRVENEVTGPGGGPLVSEIRLTVVDPKP